MRKTKMGKKLLSLLLTLALVLSFVPANVNAAEEEAELAFQSEDIDINDVDAYELEILLNTDEGCTYELESAKTSVVTIEEYKEVDHDYHVKLTPINYGSTTITATEYKNGKATGRSATADVDVLVTKDGIKKYETVYIQPSEKVVVKPTYMKDTFNHDNDVYNSETWDQGVVYYETSSFATVEVGRFSGEITAKKEGKAVITVHIDQYLNGKNHKDSHEIQIDCPVVVSTFASKINVPDKEVTLAPTESYEIKPTIEPENEAVKTVSYESDNEAVAVVSKTGKITAISAGTANITVTSDDVRKASTTIKVTVVSPAKEITAASSYSVLAGKTVDLKATVDKDATIKTLTYQSADEKIATVDKDGIVTGVKAGKTTVTIATTDGSKLEKKVDITVADQITAIKVADTNALQNVEIGKTVTVPVAITAENNDNYLDLVTATSSASNVATAKMTKDGVVITGVAEGTAKITIASKNDGVSNVEDTIVVTVKKAEVQAPTTQELKKQTISFAKVKSYKAKALKKKKITFSLKAKTTGDGTLTYKVTKGKAKYITVSKKTGKVTLKKKCKKGTYKITITAAATSVYKMAKKVVTIKVK